MGNSPALEQVIVLFLIMIVGMIISKLGIVDSYVRKKLSTLLLYVTFPFLTIASFNLEFSSNMLKNAGLVFAFSTAIQIISVLLGLVLYRRFPLEKQKILRFITVFSNNSFMGIPVLGGMYGGIGIFYASIYNVSVQIFTWTFGVVLFSGDRKNTSLGKILFNPGTISVALGMGLFLLSIRLPIPIQKSLELVGGMTAPLSMLIIGALLTETDLKTLFTGMDVYYGSFVRLILIPLGSIMAIKFLPVEDEILRSIAVLVSMPAAASTVIFAEKYGADSVFASRCVALSTILSIITIPIIVGII